MKPQDLAGIHDILPLEKPPLIGADWLIGIAGVIVTGVIVLLLRRYLRPINRLQRDLHKRRITAREAAHRLAHIPGLPPNLSTTVDQLRFSPQPPDAEALLALIEKIRDDR